MSLMNDTCTYSEMTLLWAPLGHVHMSQTPDYNSCPLFSDSLV